jgi:tetratricopeptide (TPR) repeat protein
MANDIRLQDQEKLALSTHYLRSGRRRMVEQDYQAAVQDLEKAVALDLRNEEALRLLQRAHLQAGDAPAYAATLEALAEERQASVDERRQVVARWFDEGEELLRLERYAEAEQRFQRVLEALRWSEVPLQPGSMRDRAQAHLVRAQVKARDAELRQRERQEQDARDAADRERQR